MSMYQHKASEIGIFLTTAAALAFIFSLLIALNAFADPGKALTGNVMVHVRAVQAMDPTNGSDDNETQAQAGSDSEIKCDRSIADLRSKLQQLSYKRFRLVDNEKRLIGLTHRETIALSGGETLTVRPLYVDRNRIGMFLDWQDRKGATILNTRMHFTPGESVLTGTDHGTDTGMILAIDVRPSEAAPGQ